MKHSIVAVAALVVLTACAGSRPIEVPQGWTAENAAWRLDPAWPVSAESSTLHLLVMASHCGNLVPRVAADVAYRPDHIVIATTLVLQQCLTGPGPVAFTLNLVEPIGNRALVDPNAPLWDMLDPNRPRVDSPQVGTTPTPPAP